MKSLKFFTLGFIFALFLSISVQHTLAGIASFKTDLKAAVTNNFLAADRTRITDAFVAAYQAEWNARVAAGTVDNATNRGDFAADKVIDYMKAIVFKRESDAVVQAVASPTPLTP